MKNLVLLHVYSETSPSEQWTTVAGTFVLQPDSFLMDSHCVFVPLKAISVSPVQSEKASYPMVVTESGIVTDVRPVQPSKTCHPMLVTESGMVTEVSPVQPLKA